MQTLANKITHDSLILWDGSLSENTFETSTQTIKQLLKEARENHNTILAFSKKTQLLLYGYRLTDLIEEQPAPCLLKIQNCPERTGSLNFMGNIYVVKLTRDSYAFRLDMDKELSDEQAVEAVQKLLGNDLISHGYSQTLSLAHIFSTFTATEVLGIQRCISKENNINIVTRPNIRRILFGRFGKGPEGH